MLILLVTQCDQHRIKEQDVLLDKAGRGAPGNLTPDLKEVKGTIA